TSEGGERLGCAREAGHHSHVERETCGNHLRLGVRGHHQPTTRIMDAAYVIWSEYGADTAQAPIAETARQELDAPEGIWRIERNLDGLDARGEQGFCRCGHAFGCYAAENSDHGGSEGIGCRAQGWPLQENAVLWMARRPDTAAASP